MTWQELANSYKKGIFRMVLHTVREILRNNVFIRSTCYARVGKYLLDLRSENKNRVPSEIVKRFDAEAVSRAEDLALFAVPDRKSPHSIKPLYTVLPPTSVRS